MLAATLSPNGLLLLALAAIVGLVFLIARFKFNAFIALMIASLFVGLGSGMPLGDIVGSFEGGVGKTLGFLGMIIGLGTILGKLLAESGAAEVIASTMVRMLGVKRLDYALMLVAFLVGISVFFGVGIVLLGPIAFSLARETRMPILRLALPLAAGMSTAHGLIPPHPGPMAAIGVLGADTGKTILWSVLLGLPVALITGPFLARWVAPRVPVEIGGLGAQSTSGGSAPRKPSFAISMFTMLLPVILMLIASAADLVLAKESVARHWANLIGAPTVAMLIAVLVAFITFGRSVGLSADRILKFSEDCVGPAAAIFLVVGAGGGFSAVLKSSGVGDAIALKMATMPVSPLLLGWIIAGLLRVAVGSATVAVTMAAGLVAPLLTQHPEVNRELLVLSMGAGSLILSHVNDSGFWFVKEYLGMDVPQTLKTWTVVETGIAVVSIILILIANAVVS
ncbi:GntT/GntP/DsdX family permease [Verrucomicrobiota bacterium sgz303538]